MHSITQAREQAYNLRGKQLGEIGALGAVPPLPTAPIRLSLRPSAMARGAAHNFALDPPNCHARRCAEPPYIKARDSLVFPAWQSLLQRHYQRFRAFGNIQGEVSERFLTRIW